ncbi:transposase [Carbonactinospora thermoautotrophica]|uniref:Transposase n=1 Tax=Carbonactinospora thermoautotrophica TaxID=1469144 RepID=A0A132N570_9ACTN|nr:transposase family protein [Carbonactinospora thermoautotrophica]KWX00888.1 Transposase [Carbonactinospora thermoautotrophica]KWX04644.1 transposase [Carbonactinospora thermoautotrophica]KWX04676.1 transposase [Carbonactinospora thermoautotrophica]KWX05278.1 transposase [Carbonactinospora thermoautotrophica]KWX10855.1 transposase [Carbonactinospora thermoautotrophica]
MVTYPATLAVSRQTVLFVSGLLRAERRRRGTRRGSRALTCFRQAVLVLRWFADATRVDALARDHKISIATAYRYLHEGIDVLADAAPDLHQVLTRSRTEGISHLILDGTLVETDRVAACTEAGHDEWYSGKHARHGGNIQLVCAPDGFPLWTSQVSPGRTHDLAAARELALPALYASRLPTLADKGYIGAGIGVHTPIRNPPGTQVLSVDNRARNRIINALRAVAERGIALLKTRWKALQHVTLDPWRIGAIVRAALVLTQFEHGRRY